MISWARPGILSRERPLYPLLILVNVLLASFLTVFASVATIIASSSIQGSLALSDTMTVWLTTINLLGANSMVPAGSSLGDRFGYKKMFAIGLILFALSTVLVATAENVVTILAGRLIEGFGTGLIFPVGLSLIVQNTTSKQRPLALILYMAAIFGGGFAFGLPFSAYLTQFASWRSIFYLIFILSIVSTLICWLAQEETERKNSSKFDIWGFLSFIGFFALILI